jgi:hypothetical protein
MILKAFAGFIVGYCAGERRATEVATPCENGSASGWLSAFLILIALLAWGHVDLRPPARSDAHGVVVHSRAAMTNAERRQRFGLLSV